MKIRDRIKSLRRVKASEILPHPKNWRVHPPEQQDALRGVLAEIGWAGAALVRETKDGLQFIDGHARGDVAGDTKIPVLVLDVTEEEANKILATHDPLASMATADEQALGELLAQIDTESEALQEMLDGLAEGFGDVPDEEVKLKQLDPKPPPKMTWALIGIPTVRFGEIAEIVEAIAELPETIVETTANDG